MIIIVNYNMGNVGSILNMLKKVGAEGIISSDPEVILRAEKLILPGVGAFDQGVANLENLGLIPILNEKVLVQATPIIGICLGMQLMTESSEEGKNSGLGWVKGRTVRFDRQRTKQLKIPHMGWDVIIPRKESDLMDGLSHDARFYFVHSYHVLCENTADVLTTTTYGYEFASSFQHGNIFGVQFHPEKSHKYGMKLLKNFVEYL
ncbi:MAG: imidazole glycerol phosphate synthase subunit HisH [Proteobacteria bacterium]|nr:imidazole glycerol phosphate synthase subunit HisH [Pseudomonadota bacterium]MBU1688675.1 imidazole glycerol phosphate synthase subunit HisH [Pseudomonadota bacterium]